MLGIGAIKGKFREMARQKFRFSHAYVELTRNRGSVCTQCAIVQECSRSSAQGRRNKGQGIYMTRMRQIADGGDKECNRGSGFPQIAHSYLGNSDELLGLQFCEGTRMPYTVA